MLRIAATFLLLALACSGKAGEKPADKDPPPTCDAVRAHALTLGGADTPQEIKDGYAKMMHLKCVGNGWTEEQMRCALKSKESHFPGCDLPMQLPPR